MTLETTRISLIHQETGVLMNLMATGFSLSGHSSCGCKKRIGWNIAMCDSRAARPSGPRLESSERASESLIVEIDQKLFFCIPGHWHWDLRMIKIKKKKKEQRDEEPSCWLYHPTIVNIIKYTVPLTSQLHSLPNLVIPEALRPMTCLWKRLKKGILVLREGTPEKVKNNLGTRFGYTKRVHRGILLLDLILTFLDLRVKYFWHVFLVYD